MKTTECTCARVALDVQTYYAGMNQLTHPNVISFEEPWHGYQYYMAYTAYPFANGSEENPCLAASNDLIHWEKPKGLINPIACCEETECDELKDTHLLYRPDLDRLELWYLGRISATIQMGGPLYCFRKTSKDGIHWSCYEVMYRFDEIRLASPSIIYEQGSYRFWGIRHDKADIGLYSMSSKDGLLWSNLTRCNVDMDKETDMWHGTVSYYAGGYDFVWVGREGQWRNKICYATSVDGCCFKDTKTIVHNDAGWSFLYRPALLRCSQGVYVYYGVGRCDGKWMVALSHGAQPECLRGTTVEEVPIAEERIARTGKLVIKQWMKGVAGFIIPRLSLLIPGLFFLDVVLNSTWLNWVIAVLLSGMAYYFCFDRKHFIQGGVVSGTAYSAIAVFLSDLVQELFTIL